MSSYTVDIKEVLKMNIPTYKALKMNIPTYKILLINGLLSNYHLIQNLIKPILTFNATVEWLQNFDINLLNSSDQYYDAYLIIYELEKAIEWSKIITPIPVIFITDNIFDGIEAIKNGLSDYLIEKELNSYSLERSLRLSINHFQTKIKLKKYQYNYHIQLENQIQIQEKIIKNIISSRSFTNHILQVNEQQYVTLAEAVQVGLYHNDSEGNCIYINQKCCEILDITLDECIGKGWVSRLHPDDQEFVWKSWDEAFETKSPWENEYRFIQRDGTIIWVYAQTVFVFDEQGENIGSVGSLTDITQRKNLEEALREREEFFRDIASNIPSAIFRYVLHQDKSEQLIYMSPNCQKLWEFNADEVAHDTQTFWEMIHRDDLVNVKKSLAISAQTLKNWKLEYRIITPSGKEKWLEGAGKPQRKQNGDIVWNCAVQDISHRKLAEQVLHRYAFYDNLTGLANRFVFFNHLEKIFAEGKIGDKTNLSAILYLDLEKFKEINDTHGHKAGDHLLQQVAQRLSECVSSEDILARIGGDEFGIILENINYADEALEVAQRIHERLSVPFELEHRCVSITTSIGIRFYQPETYSPLKVTLLLDDADTAMYQAKNSGSGQTAIFTPEMRSEGASKKNRNKRINNC